MKTRAKFSKKIFSVLLCLAMLLSYMPVTALAAEGNVASITAGGTTTYYTSLSGAAAAVEEGQTISLLSDITIAADETVTFAAFADLDANGHSITCCGSVVIGDKEGIIFNNELYYYGGDITQGRNSAGALLSLVKVPDITYYTAGDGYLTVAPNSEKSAPVIELHNVSITHDLGSVEAGVINYSGTDADSLTILFYGNNTIYSSSDGSYSAVLYADGDITMIGMEEGAVLTLNTAGRYGVVANNLKVESGIVSVYAAGGHEAYAISANKKVTVNSGAVLTAAFGSVTSGFACGVLAPQIDVQEGGTLNGLYVTADFEIGKISFTVYGKTVLESDFIADPFSGTDAEGLYNYAFSVPEGAFLEVKENVTLDLSTQTTEDIDLSGTIVNNGIIKFPADFPLGSAPKSGTIMIGKKTYTYDQDNEKWICVGEVSHVTEKDENKATCQRGNICDICGIEYGEKDGSKHKYVDNICTLCDARYLGISIGGSDVTSVNAADVFGDGTVSFDADTSILTIHNATVDTTGMDMPALKIASGDVTLALEGTNVLKGYDTGKPLLDADTEEWYGYAAIEIADEASLTITGSDDDSLAVQGNAFGYTKVDHIAVTASIYGDGNLIINGGTISSASDRIDTSGQGVYLNGDYIQNGGTVDIGSINANNVTVTNGVLDAAGSNGFNYADQYLGGTHGICAGADITISGGTVTASGGLLAGNGDLKDGFITSGSSVLPDGLCAGKSVTVTGGTVTAAGSACPYRVDDMGFASLGNYTEEGEGKDTGAGDGLNGYAIDAPSYFVSENATFICGSENSHLFSTADCMAPVTCGFCRKTIGEIDSANHASDEYTYDDNGNGTHKKTHECGIITAEAETHDYKEGICACGVEIIAPTGTITIKNNSWNKFLNWISFGFFYKDSVDVIITADGTGSDVTKVEYLLSKTALDSDRIPTEGWAELTEENDEYSFRIASKNKGAVYVRITDTCDNVTVINSDGIVVYADSKAEKDTAEHTYQSTENLVIKLKLNGNTIKDLKFNGHTIANCWSAEGDEVTIFGSYLSRLNVLGEGSYYPITISFNPVGEETDQVALETEVKLVITPAEGSVTNVSNISKTYDGTAVSAPSYSSLSKGAAAYEYKVKGAADSTYTSEAPINAGDYVVRVTVAADRCYKEASAVAEFSIAPANMDTAVVTLDQDTFEYDGTAHKPNETVTLNGVVLKKDVDYKVTYQIPMKWIDGKPVKWYGDGVTSRDCIDVGDDYFAVVEGIGNYCTKDNHTLYARFAVDKATIIEPVIASKSYTGSVLKAEISDTELYTVEQNEGGIARGSYHVVLKLTDTENYRWKTTEDATVTLQFTIIKATYDMSGAKWDYTDAFTYDGLEKTVAVTGLPEGVTVSGYTGEKAVAAGTYTAKAALAYDEDNYNAPVIEDLTWKIEEEWSSVDGSEEESDKTISPDTGDHTNVFGNMIAMMISVMAIVFVLAGKKRKVRR